MESILTTELKSAIDADAKIKTLQLYSDDWFFRLEELRSENCLEYRRDKSPKWVRDRKYSIPYLVTDEDFQKKHLESYS